MLGKLRGYSEARAMEAEVRAHGALPADLEDPSSLYRNDCAQPLICLYQAMVWAVVKARLPEPELFAGYSLGELSAYGCAGQLAWPDVVKLAGVRGRLMQAAASSASGQAMVAVLGLSLPALAAVARAHTAFPAIINGKDHVIYGMPAERAASFVRAAAESGATRTVLLPVAAAAHTPHQAGAAAAFAQELRLVAHHPSGRAVLSGVSGQKIWGREEMIAALSGQIRQTIDWQAGMETAHGLPGRVFLELGPGSSLVRLLQDAFPGVEARSADEFHDLTAVGKWVEAALRRQHAC